MRKKLKALPYWISLVALASTAIAGIGLVIYSFVRASLIQSTVWGPDPDMQAIEQGRQISALIGAGGMALLMIASVCIPLVGKLSEWSCR